MKLSKYDRFMNGAFGRELDPNDDQYFETNFRGERVERLEPRCLDKNKPFKTFLHYSDPRADQERTVFGEAKDNLFYNYSDRLMSDEWSRGCKKANKTPGVKPHTARWFEIALNEFHGTDTVDLQHVVLGCSRMSGYHYLIFGYTYDSDTETEK